MEPELPGRLTAPDRPVGGNSVREETSRVAIEEQVAGESCGAFVIRRDSSPVCDEAG